MPARRFPLLLAAIAVTFVAGLVLSGSLQVTPRTDAGSPATGAVPASAPNLPKSVTIPSFADIAAAALPGVVSITSTGVATETAEQRGGIDPFEFFFGPRNRRGPQGEPRQRRQVAAGSGFLISDSGWILTNNHVISGASRIQVTLTDREVFDAKLVGRDPAIDVALLKIDAGKKLPALSLGDSDKIRVGDPVMAIGNPLRFAGTVTVGVLSAKGRRGISDDPASASLQDLLQTDAAINFGNYGGPLLNTAAEVTGMNTAMIQPAQNIGFAVAINGVKQILPQLEKSGKVERGMLGVRVGPVDQDIQKAFKLPSIDGAFIESVDAGKAADRAGIRPGDTIIQVDDVPVREPRDLITRVSSQRPGATVRLTFLRDGQKKTASATLERFDTRTGEEAEPSSDPAGPHGERLGISLAELTGDVRQQLGIRGEIRGVVVADVRETSPAADQGLAPGDVITEINGAPVSSIAQFRTELGKVKRGDYVRLYVRRFQPEEVSRFVIVKTG